MLPLPSRELVDRLGKAGPRYTSYPPANLWSASFGEKEARERLAFADHVAEPLSIYVHIPFCEEMCRFCGCNVIATKDRSRADEYLDLLEQEIRLWAAALPRRHRMAQLHLGGGTPTFLTPEQLSRLRDMLWRSFQPVEHAELAIEVDPAVTTPEQIRLLGHFGFNRLSVGVQDLDHTVQLAVNRVQSEAQTRRILETARDSGFTSINIDLMYGLPYQTPVTYARTLERVLSMEPDRLALFGYAHVPWMKPNQRLLPQAGLPGPSERVELFVQSARRLQEAGYRQIGLDHFSREGDELATAQRAGTLTRNFQGYSARAAPDTLALGVSAISDIGGAFIQSAHKLSDWTKAIESGHLPVERGWQRTEEDELRSAVIRMLMCLLRIDLDAFPAAYGKRPRKLFNECIADLKALEQDGLLSLRTGGLDVTPLGRLFLRNIAMVFDAYLAATEDKPAFSRTV